jgi:hypothetical protein
MSLRTLKAWLRGKPPVCSMVPIPSEADEEVRRAHREREDLTGERRSIVNKIDGILATHWIPSERSDRRQAGAPAAITPQCLVTASLVPSMPNSARVIGVNNNLVPPWRSVEALEDDRGGCSRSPRTVLGRRESGRCGCFIEQSSTGSRRRMRATDHPYAGCAARQDLQASTAGTREVGTSGDFQKGRSLVPGFAPRPTPRRPELNRQITIYSSLRPDAKSSIVRPFGKSGGEVPSTATPARR